MSESEMDEQAQFEQWNKERDHFELSWNSNDSFRLAQIPPSIEELKQFAWHVWQHAVSSVLRRQE